jgi:hypothetical protein
MIISKQFGSRETKHMFGFNSLKHSQAYPSWVRRFESFLAPDAL